MNLLLSLSTLNPAANCPKNCSQENWQIATREREYPTLILGILGYLANAGMSGEMQGKSGDCTILPNDTIVSISEDPSKTLDRFLDLPLRQDSINQSFSEIASQMQNYRHESDRNNNERERLFVGLNPKPTSGRYGSKPKVPQ
ncbi:MAG: hypothetical protein J7647_16045 [Cyanobacteria bacterium SBLK]|nr:hypothetical protein [Cyanobacteria bacterium SBLK]